MNRKCENYLEKIPDYIDGSLPANQRAAFEKHMTVCNDCAQNLSKQQEWLEGSFVNQEDVELTSEDKIRLQEQIMATIRSNEQSNRAAAYINDYKSRNVELDKTDEAAISRSYITSAKTSKQTKDRKLWRSLPVLTGYAAVFVLVFVTVILVRDLNITRSNSSLIGKDERVVVNEEDGMNETLSDDMGLGSLADDSATLPMIDSEEMTSLETTAAMVMDMKENQNDADEGDNTETAASTPAQWKIFSGRLEELSLNPELFADNEAFDVQGVFYSSKALRILITNRTDQIATVPDSISDSDEEIGETSQTTTRATEKPQSVIDQVMILTAWYSWDIELAADNLNTQLQENDTDYDIIILDDSVKVAEIEAMIGPDETKAWKEQINTQELDDLVWLALITK